MFAPRASDVAFGSDVHCVNDVVPLAQWASITSLRAFARNIIMSEANNITFAIAKTPPQFLEGELLLYLIYELNVIELNKLLKSFVRSRRPEIKAVLRGNFAFFSYN